MPGLNLGARWARWNGTANLTVAEISDDLISTPSTVAYRIAVGSTALVSGTVAVATGLNTVKTFTATMSGATGFASGVTEVCELLVGSITTGSVTVTGVFNSFVTGAATLSASGTGTFNWIALGT